MNEKEKLIDVATAFIVAFIPHCKTDQNALDLIPVSIKMAKKVIEDCNK